MALLTGVLAGCTPEAEKTEPTPAFASEAEAFAAAEETYRAYVDALNQVDLSDPETFEEVYAWTTGELNAQDRSNFSAWHADSVDKSGAASIDRLDPVSADPVNADVVLDACFNVSGVVVLDSEGQSLVDSTRP